MDYGFSKAFLEKIYSVDALKDNFKIIGQFLPKEAYYPALLFFTDKVEEINAIIPNHEQVKVFFSLKILSHYSGLQELYRLLSLINLHLNGCFLETEGRRKIYMRLSSPSFEGLQKTKTRNYRCALIKGIGYMGGS
jgi:hypothetical protein